MVEKIKEPLHRPVLKKYLITWSLLLGRDELEKISRHPEVLQKGLEYVKNTAKQSKLEIYRIAQIEEVTHFERPTHTISATAHPHGVAIARANSIEEARKMINFWVEGFGFGGVPVQNYLEYDIKLLVEIATTGGMQ
jgi:hypothetical protein